jgi:hypothetical protein
MSPYIRWYNDRKNFYKIFAERWAAWADDVELSPLEATGMSKFFKPIAKRFGLTQYFVELGVLAE